MGNEYVDPGWGALGTSLINAFRDAPKKALDQKMTVEQIIALREEQARKKAIFDTNVQSGQSVADTLGTFGPPKSVRNITTQMPGPWNPDDPATVMPTGDALTMPTAPVTTREEYVDPIVEARYKAELPMYQSIARAVAQGQGGGDLLNTYGRATAGLQGVPTDLAERERLNVIMTGKLLPPGERKAPNGQNLSVIGADGQPTGRGYMSFDGGRTAQDGTPIRLGPGEQLMETGPAPLAKENPIGSPAIAQNNFNKMAAQIKAKIARNEPISNEELNAARNTRDAGWQKKLRFDTDPLTGKRTHTPHYDIVPPEAGDAADLFDILDNVDNVPSSRAAARTAVPAAPVVTPDPAAAAGGAPAVPAAPVPVVAPARAPRDLVGPTTATGAGDPRPIVQDYKTQPVITSIENAKNGYSSLLGAIANNDKSADLAMIVGAAKVLDPPSVVREGEVENVRKTGGVMDHFIGLVQGAKGESGLSKQVRAQLWQMVNEKLKLDVANAAAIREQHMVQLKQRGVPDPDVYLPPLPDIVPVDPSKISTHRINVQGVRGRVPNNPTPTTASPTATPTPDQLETLDRDLGITK